MESSHRILSFSIPQSEQQDMLALAEAMNSARSDAFTISMAELSTNAKQLYVNLNALQGLSATERAAMLRLAIANEKPTCSVSQPSAHFATYVQYAVSDELTKTSPAPRDVMRERLWAAAQHDVFTNTGAIASMLDSGGLARVDFSEYQRIIENCLQPLIEAGY